MIKVSEVKEKPKLGERNHLCKFYSRHQFLLLLLPHSPLSLLPKNTLYFLLLLSPRFRVKSNQWTCMHI